MRSAIGVPVVRPSNTPESISTASASRRWVTCLEVPGFLRSRSRWMSATASSIPGGQPSTTQPIAGPCDSPKDVTQKSVPSVLPDMARCETMRVRRSVARAFGGLAPSRTSTRDAYAMSLPWMIDPTLVNALRDARFIAALTGAGISAESGIATFRDAPEGLWARFDPRELATPSAFARNPKRVWDWYAWRRERVAEAQPNAGHLALAALERRTHEFVLVTQNVDGLHQRAGSRNVVELHGNIARVKCSRDGTPVERWEAKEDEVPRCPDCGAYLRPDVVWFEELLPEDALAAAEEAALRC